MNYRLPNLYWTVLMLPALLAPQALEGRAKAVDAVDINRASVAELMALPGVTAVWAARIVRYRPYHSKLDLINEGVVSAEVYGRIRDRIVAHRGR